MQRYGKQFIFQWLIRIIPSNSVNKFVVCVLFLGDVDRHVSEALSAATIKNVLDAGHLPLIHQNARQADENNGDAAYEHRQVAGTPFIRRIFDQGEAVACGTGLLYKRIGHILFDAPGGLRLHFQLLLFLKRIIIVKLFKWFILIVRDSHL